MAHKLTIALALLGSLGATAVQAEVSGIAERPDLTLTLANQLADATLSACHAQQRTAVVAVVARHLPHSQPKRQPDFWPSVHAITPMQPI